MYSHKSYKLNKDEYNYLLPVLRNKLLYRCEIDTHYFRGDPEELSDMLSRLKGLYNYYNYYNKIIDYKCFKYGSLDSFRKEVVSL